MENLSFTVGVDVSKKTLDICLMSVENASAYCFYKVPNNLKGHLAMLRWIEKQKAVLTGCLFILEHTGMYSLILGMFLKKQGLLYTMVPGLVIKNSLGICRGKNDKKDAFSLARYGYLYREEMQLNPIKDEQFVELQTLFSQRQRLVGALKALTVPIKEMQEMGLDEQARKAAANQKATIDAIKADIKRIEKETAMLIEQDEPLNKQYALCTSIPGVGPQLAVYLLVVTQGFSRFDNSRQLAAYAGVAPFPYQSGTSIRGRNRTNTIADKTLKSLLHMGALNVVRLDHQLKSYYEKKKAEGKNAMLILNAVRNKLLARILATINRGTPYVQLAQHVS